MTDLGIGGYIAVFLATSILTVLLVPLSMRLAIRLNILDYPGGYKQQSSPVPYLGGAAIVLAFSAAIMTATVLRPPVGGLSELAMILGAAVVLTLIGLVDDIRGLPLWPRAATEVGAAMALWMAGVRVDLFSVEWADVLLTVVWIVGVTNAMNLLDNMDGLSAGVAAIASAWFFIIAAFNGQFLVAGLSVALAGCALGFLRHNSFPARIYMGDAGSLFFGLMLAVLGVKLRFDAPVQVTAMVPLIVLGLPLFDTALVVISRLGRGENPFQGGADHVSHRLVRRGAPVPLAVRGLYLVTAGLGWLALIVSRLDDIVTAYLLMSFVGGFALFAGAVLLKQEVPMWRRGAGVAAKPSDRHAEGVSR